MNTDSYTCLVFDWDGTLIDSIERIVCSLQSASQQVCAQTISEQRARNVIGLGLVEAIEQLHPGLEAVKMEAVAEAYKQHFLFENPIQSELFEGVTDMLYALRDAGFTLAIATGKSRRGLDRSLREHQLEHLFTTTRCADEHPSKPRPDMLLDILEQLNIPAQQTLMIGDSEHDLMMANNARVKAVAVSQGVQQAEVLLKHQPLTCLDRITDLSDFLAHTSNVQ